MQINCLHIQVGEHYVIPGTQKNEQKCQNMITEFYKL